MERTTFKVIDQGSLRKEELETYLAVSTANFAVITDMAMFEMMKGEAPLYVAERSLDVISRLPEQICVTGATGELIRRELETGFPIENPLDEKLTGQFRHFLRAVRGYLDGKLAHFPLEEQKIKAEIETPKKERLDHVFHKDALVGAIRVLRELEDENLKMKIRSGIFDDDVYGFIYQAGFLTFRNAVNERKLPTETIQYLFLKGSLGARMSLAQALSGFEWFRENGLDSMDPVDVTNQVHDNDYVVMASYFDGLIFREKRIARFLERYRRLLERDLDPVA